MNSWKLIFLSDFLHVGKPYKCQHRNSLHSNSGHKVSNILPCSSLWYQHKTYCFVFAKMISTSVDVTFLSKSLKSRKNLPNLAPSICIGASLLLPPKEQKVAKMFSMSQLALWVFFQLTFRSRKVAAHCWYTGIGIHKMLLAEVTTPTHTRVLMGVACICATNSMRARSSFVHT